MIDFPILAICFGIGAVLELWHRLANRIVDAAIRRRAGMRPSSLAVLQIFGGSIPFLLGVGLALFSVYGVSGASNLGLWSFAAGYACAVLIGRIRDARHDQNMP